MGRHIRQARTAQAAAVGDNAEDATAEGNKAALHRPPKRETGPNMLRQRETRPYCTGRHRGRQGRAGCHIRTTQDVAEGDEAVAEAPMLPLPGGGPPSTSILYGKV